MRLADLERWTDRMISLSPEFWAKARLLGEARERSNDRTRAPRRGRGVVGNHKVDLQGAAAELILLKCVRECDDSAAAVAAMQAHLYNRDGGRDVRGADLEFENGDRTIRIDAKSFAPQIKRNLRTGRVTRYIYFAINAGKHAELGELGCYAYFCVITPHYGRRAIISDLVPWGHVDGWDREDLAGRGDPSRNLLMDVFLPNYVHRAGVRSGRRFETLDDLEDLRTGVHDRSDVERLMRSAEVRQSLGEEIPTLAPVLAGGLHAY